MKQVEVFWFRKSRYFWFRWRGIA